VVYIRLLPHVREDSEEGVPAQGKKKEGRRRDETHRKAGGESVFGARGKEGKHTVEYRVGEVVDTLRGNWSFPRPRKKGKKNHCVGPA